MTRIKETSLPGVGLRHEFVTEDGQRIGVIHHRTGRAEMFVCPPNDPDAVALTVSLSDEDSVALAEVLGRSTVTENLLDLQQRVQGLAIDWLNVDEGSPYVGKTIGDARIRTRTGVSVVAVIRGDDAHPAPGPGFEMETGDTLVVVGTAKGIRAVDEILTAG